MQGIIKRGRHRYRTHVATFLAGTLLGMLIVGGMPVNQAEAQIPDPAERRFQAAKDRQQTNRLLSEVINVLRTQTLKVRIIDSDKDRDSPKRRATPKR